MNRDFDETAAIEEMYNQFVFCFPIFRFGRSVLRTAGRRLAEQQASVPFDYKVCLFRAEGWHQRF